MSTIKVDTIATRTGSGTITVSNDLANTGHASIGVSAVDASRALTVAGATDGSGSSALVVYNSSLASKFSVRDDGLTTITNNATVGGTLGVTGNSTANSINLGGRSLGAGGTPLGVNFSSASTNGMQINDTNSGNLGGFMGFYTGSGAGTNRANIQNANNAGIHMCVGTSGSVTFTNSGYVSANALDDYEEGTFTPNFSFTTTNGNHTVSGATGHYVKVGNLVNIQGYIKLASKGTASGTIRIASLPFTNINSGSSYAAVSLWANGLVNGQPMDGDFMQYAIINPGGDHIRLWAMTGTGAVHEANQGDVQDQSDFMFTVSYRHA